MKNILTAIGGFFSKLYKGIVSGADPTLITFPTDLSITPAEINECIKAVNIIKDIVNNPVTILVTDLTPITMDNEIRSDISNAIPGILAGLTYADDIVSGTPETTDQVNAMLAKVRLSDDPSKDALYHALAVRFIMIASKGKVSWSDGVGIIELYFKQVFSAPVAAIVQPVATAVQSAENTAAPILTAVSYLVPAAAPIVADIQAAEVVAAPILAAVQSPAPVAAPVAVQAVEQPLVTLPPLTAVQVAAILANSAAAITA